MNKDDNNMTVSMAQKALAGVKGMLSAVLIWLRSRIGASRYSKRSEEVAFANGSQHTSLTFY